FNTVDACNAAAPADEGQDLRMFSVLGLGVQIEEYVLMFRHVSGATCLQQALLDLAGAQADQHPLQSPHRPGQPPGNRAVEQLDVVRQSRDVSPGVLEFSLLAVEQLVAFMHL